jgi:hypothetical protein
MPTKNSAPHKIPNLLSEADWETIATGRVLAGHPPLSLRDSRSVARDKVMVRDHRSGIKSLFKPAMG